MHSREIWQNWAESLRRLKLDGLASWLVEAGAPLHLIGAHTLYFSLPFVGGNQIKLIAQMLENEDETRAFATFLRDEAKP